MSSTLAELHGRAQARITTPRALPGWRKAIGGTR
jgi:hypothetical protein